MSVTLDFADGIKPLIISEYIENAWSYEFIVTNEDSHSGGYCLTDNVLITDGAAYLRVEGYFNAGTLTFWYKLVGDSCEIYASIDGNDYNVWEDSNGWVQVSLTVSTAGEHEFYLYFYTWGDPAVNHLYLDDITMPMDYSTEMLHNRINFNSGLLPDGTTNDATNPWLIDNTTVPSGFTNTLRSTIEGQDSTETVITFPEIVLPQGGLFSLYARVNAEYWNDYLRVKINGVTQFNLRGMTHVDVWRRRSYFYDPSTSHSLTVELVYHKDTSDSFGDDNAVIAELIMGSVIDDGTVRPYSILPREGFGVNRVHFGYPPVKGDLKVYTALYGEIAVMPLEAIVPCVETLSWLTDIMTTRNGTEFRLRTRDIPRQQIKYTLFEQRQHLAETLITQYYALNSSWGVPIWFEAQPVGALPAGTAVISMDTSDCSFTDQSLAFVYDSPDNWQLIEIDTVSPDSLVLLSGVVYDFNNAQVMPARIGEINKGIDKKHSGFDAVTSIKFDMTEHYEYSEADAPAQFLGDDIYYDEVLKPSGDRYKQAIETRVDTIDHSLGLFDRIAPWSNSRISRTIGYLLQGKSEIMTFKRFLERRAGKFKPFWEPSFAADLHCISAGIVESVLIVDDLTWSRWDNQRNHIAILDTAGNWYPRTISSHTVNSDNGTVELTLDSPLSLPAEQIEMISYLGLKRFDTDSITINWIGNRVMKASINVLEISS